MAVQYYPDGNGDTIRLLEDDGRLTPVSATAQWHHITQMTSKDDDVLICTYPKSGTHWVWEIVSMLLTGEAQVTPSAMWSNLLQFLKDEEVAQMKSPRVFCTHRQFQDIPSDFILKRRKLVLVTREPKDVCVSYYDFYRHLKCVEYEGTFDGFLPLFLRGKVPFNSWPRWILSYEKGLKEHPELPYLHVKYEELLEDPVNQIARLAEYLGVPAQMASQVAEQTKFKGMKNVKATSDDPFAHRFKDGQSHIFNKGKSGRWKERFNEEQAQQFEDTLCKQLGRDSLTPLF